jgi:FdhE protein
MTSITPEIKELATEIEQLTTAKPHAASLFRAFGPILLAEHRWLRKMQDSTRIFPVDPLKYHGGIALIQQVQLFLPEDPWQDAGLSVAGAIAQGFPHFSKDMRRLSQQISEEGFDCFALGDSSPDDNQLTEQAEKLGIEPVALQLFQRCLSRLMLKKRAQDMTGQLTSLSWTKGYCPVCGSFPHLAIIREQGQRWLQCSCCSHEWIFPRLKCPQCDHEDPQETNYLFVQGNKEDTAFTCSKCRKYLITSNQSGNLRGSQAELIALSLAHLDLILQDKGFQPMAECEWNTFTAPQKKEDGAAV